MSKLFDTVKQALVSLHHTHVKGLPLDRAQKIVEDATAPTSLLIEALYTLLGKHVLAWEPESIWLAVPELSLSNRDKVSAAITLLTTSSFLYDYRAFGHMVLAFNHLAVAPETIPQPTASELAWGCLEAELIIAVNSVDTEHVSAFNIDDDPAAFTATCLFHDGLVLCPEILSFAQGPLDKFLDEDSLRLKESVKEKWSGGIIDTNAVNDTSVNSQITRLVVAQESCLAHLQRLMPQLLLTR